VTKPKRARKRATLAAVPDGEGSAKKATKSPRAPLVDRSQAPQGLPRPVLAPATAARPAGNASRKKRELPPYLRIVK
jgi:hypothetical protein